MIELWRDVVGHEDTHQVSSHGRVRSCDSVRPNRHGTTHIRRGKVLNQGPNNGGYLRARLFRDCSYTRHFVHRLVALAFIEAKSEDQIQVNHKDKDRTNNYVSNLEWVTPSENQLHANRGHYE